MLACGPRLPNSSLKGGPSWAAIYRAADRPPGGGGWGWVPFQFKVQVLLTNPLLSFQLTPQLLPNRPQPPGSQTQLLSRLKSGSQAPPAIRPVGTEAAHAAAAGNRFVNCWLKLVLIFGPRLPNSRLKGGPPRAAIYRAAVRPPGGGGGGWLPFQILVQVQFTNPNLSFQLTIRRIPNRPQSSGSQAQLQTLLKSGS